MTVNGSPHESRVIHLPNPRDREAVTAHIRARATDFYRRLTGRDPPSSIIATPADSAPAAVNFEALMCVLAQLELDQMYLYRKLQALESGLQEIRFSLRGFSN